MTRMTREVAVRSVVLSAMTAVAVLVITGSVQSASTAPHPQLLFADRGNIYSVTRDRDLVWFKDTAQNGTWSWANDRARLVGWGWNVSHVFSARNGIVYSVNPAGQLLWNKDATQNGTFNWAPNSGVVVGTGWGGHRYLTSNGNGVIYGIDGAGILRYYRHSGFGDGSPTWNTGAGGVPIGSGWADVKAFFADDNDVLYSVSPNGDLRWWKDLDHAGHWHPNSGAVIGTGWGGFKHLFSGANGVIYGVDRGGNLRWHKDLLRDGTSRPNGHGWATNGGSIIGTGWRRLNYVPDLSEFGYATIKMNGKLAFGTRPLLIVMAEYQSGPAGFTFPPFSQTHGSVFYDRLGFRDPAFPPFNANDNPASLTTFVRENSNSRFSFVRAGAGVVGPVNLGDSGALTDATTAARNMRALSDPTVSAAIKLGDFDTNNDGIVTSDELTVLIVDNVVDPSQPTGNPANRAATTFTAMNSAGASKSIQLSSVAMVNCRTDFYNIAHEVMHGIGIRAGGDQLRNATPNGPNTNLSIMGAGSGIADNQNPVHLDPFHRMALGWAKPDVRRITTVDDAEVSRSTSSRVLLLWDLHQGFPREMNGPGISRYFLVERRQATSHDMSVANGGGNVVWRVDPWTTTRVGALGSPGLAWGSNATWGASGATPALTWAGGGSTGSALSFATALGTPWVSW